MENHYQILGRKIRFYREQADLTQAKLAEKAGVSNNFIGLIERGIKHPALETLIRISQVLEINLYDLFFPLKTGIDENKIAAVELKKLLNKRNFKDAKLLLLIYKNIRDHIPDLSNH